MPEKAWLESAAENINYCQPTELNLTQKFNPPGLGLHSIFKLAALVREHFLYSSQACLMSITIGFNYTQNTSVSIVERGTGRIFVFRTREP